MLRVTGVLCLCLAISQALAKPQQEQVEDSDFIELPRFFNPEVIAGEFKYFIGINQKVNWYKAAEICAFQGMTLAAIKTADEYDRLRRYLIANNIVDGKYWLGASTLSDSDEYIWITDGSRVTFNYWAPTVQPTAFKDACVHTVPRSFSWNISSCKDKNHFICQAPVKPYCDVRGECQTRSNTFY